MVLRSPLSPKLKAMSKLSRREKKTGTVGPVDWDVLDWMLAIDLDVALAKRFRNPRFLELFPIAQWPAPRPKGGD